MKENTSAPVDPQMALTVIELKEANGDTIPGMFEVCKQALEHMQQKMPMLAGVFARYLMDVTPYDQGLYEELPTARQLVLTFRDVITDFADVADVAE
jgi:hypothetical protein